MSLFVRILRFIFLRIFFNQNPECPNGAVPAEMDKAKEAYRQMAEKLGWRYTYHFRYWTSSGNNHGYNTNPWGQWELVHWWRLGLPYVVAQSSMIWFAPSEYSMFHGNIPRPPWRVWVLRAEIKHAVPKELLQKP